MCAQHFLSIGPLEFYIVHVDRRTTLVQVLMKMCGVLDDEQDYHITATVSWAFSDVGDWMVNPLSTSTTGPVLLLSTVYGDRVYVTIISKAVYVLIPN